MYAKIHFCLVRYFINANDLSEVGIGKCQLKFYNECHGKFRYIREKMSSTFGTPYLLPVLEGKDDFRSGFYFYLIPKLKISSTIGKMKHLYHLGPVPNWFRYKICFTNMRHEWYKLPCSLRSQGDNIKRSMIKMAEGIQILDTWNPDSSEYRTLH